jgi:serine protease Do
MNSLKSGLAVALLLGIALAPRSALAKEPSANLALARQLDEAFVEVAEQVSPAVVVITVVQKTSKSEEDQEGGFDSLPPGFWRYFHKQLQRPEKTLGEGSGIIIREDGYILTNGHVIDGAESIEVRLHDGRSFKASLRGIDPQSDVAVIKIDAKGLQAAVLADSAKTRVGEFAIAIGAPFSFEYSVTFGHVSAKGRSNVIQGFEAASMDQDFIQTDANINPGNSGGPLVNINGEVIGINTLIEGLHSGIGFAIPSNLAKEISDKLIAEGKFTRAWLGIEIRGMREDADFRELVKGVGDGVVVRAILPDGPAAKSDLKPSDVITAVDGKAVLTAQQLRGEIRGKPIGQPVMLDVCRPNANGRGTILKIKVSPGEWVQPAPALANSEPVPAAQPVHAGLGLTVRPLTAEVASQIGVELTQGVLVASVEQDTPAARNGIKPGDIITAINQRPVGSPKQFQEALAKTDLKKGIMVTLLSGTTARFEILKDGEE